MTFTGIKIRFFLLQNLVPHPRNTVNEITFLSSRKLTKQLKKRVTKNMITVIAVHRHTKTRIPDAEQQM